ncbi:hypothetical protein [Bdellovibrio sp. HCB-110]|uniref:hypothetical protein n=1 Tax=Bdellovibrio sp. HCB-110 TaxID=3391182 RepID=UPI0039B597B0
MLPMLQKKHTLITAALLATLTLSACGKKKDVIAAPPEESKKTGESDTNGQIGGGLPDPNKPDDYNPPLPEPIPEPRKPTPPGSTQQPNPLPPPPTAPTAPSQPPKPTTPPVVDTRPAPAPGANQLPPDYRTNDPGNATRDNLSKRMTGGVTSDGLVYTSSSTDDLLNFLRARNEKVGYETRRANVEAASSVLSAKMTIDGLSGDAIVTLKVQEGNEVKVYNVAGASNNGGYASPLRSVRAGNGEKSTGSRALEGTLKCVDLDGGCENTFVRLKIGTSPSSAIINLVFRNSSADLYFNLPGEYSNNPEYLVLRDFIVNTIQGLKVPDRIKTIRMSSWEVVNGRSGVALSMKGANNELLAFAGPLLAPEAGTGVNINLSRIAKDQEDTLDLISLDNTKLNLANTIGEARMVANNGLGQVRLALKMRKRGSYAQDQFLVTFMRRVKPLIDLTDDNLK